MKKKILNPGFIFIISILFIGTLFRLVPHWPNFTPIAAIALFGGSYLNKKYLAFIIPLLCLFLSDIIIGFHHYMIAVYFSFAIIVSMGFILRKNINLVSVISASVISSLLFFFITNFAVWYSSPFYTQDISGLVKCYIMGLPFLYNGSMGDIFFNTSFFGIFYLVTRKYPILAKI